MIGLGTIANASAVVISGCVGMLFRNKLQQRMQDILMQALGLAVIFIGIAGTLQQTFVINGSSLTTTGSMRLVLSLVLGAFVGEWINLQGHTERFGEWLKKKVKSKNDPLFIDGFVTTSLTISVGAMAVVGALQDGLSGDATMLYTKAILDGILVLVLASVFGKGTIFSIIPLTLLQGGITLGARFIQPFLTEQVIGDLSLVGSALIFCVGTNLMFKTKIRVANLLPSLLFAGLFSVLPL